MGKESLVGSEVSMGKESHVGQPTSKEANMPCISSMPTNLVPCMPPIPTQLSLSPRVHGAEIPNPFVSHGHAEGTWKRITRAGLVTDTCMSEAAGGKRSLGSDSSQTELPKKRRVS